ncbi:YceI family protein [Gynurincola endophyticus]|uniref:YceI family protein n=1 Tax=Gynurincola endophyticus TaxID=2479004 RepID=UPI000F8C88D9|nr:YceI family protein [Gynurincola endophyticus]
MKRVSLVLFAVLLGVSVFAQNWTMDASHSRVGFEVSHMTVSDVEGEFQHATATITASKADFTDAVVVFSAPVAGINTGNKMRDGHLQKEDYFDAAKHPNITFKSSSFKLVSGNKYKVIGDLTMHGITKQVELEVTYRGTVKNQRGKDVAGFKLIGTVNRKDFGIAPGTGAAALGEVVTIRVNAEFIQE